MGTNRVGIHTYSSCMVVGSIDQNNVSFCLYRLEVEDENRQAGGCGEQSRTATIIAIHGYRFESFLKVKKLRNENQTLLF